MGRRTFNDMIAYWPTSTEPFAVPMHLQLVESLPFPAGAVAHVYRPSADAGAHA